MIDVRVAYDDILAKIKSIDPIAYGETRNFSDGALTHLSPYISRGVISTQVSHLGRVFLEIYG